MTRVLYLETGSGYGGSTQSLYQLLQAIDRKRVDPVVVMSHEGPMTRRLLDIGIPVVMLPRTATSRAGYLGLLSAWARWDVPQMRHLAAMIRRLDVDLVHLNNDLYSTVAGFWAARLTRRPVVCYLRLTRPPTRLEQRLGRWADAKIVLTEEAQAFYRRWWPQDRIVWIPNSVALPADVNGAAASRQALGLPQHGPLVGLIARCVPGKGYDTFLKAARLVHERAPSATFAIFGNGHGGDPGLERDMHALADSMGLNGSVVWGGWRADTSTIYRALDIVVQASSTFPEGFGRVLIEAMAHECPVVATSISAFAEVLGYGEGGLLVPPSDPKAMAEALTMLLERPELARCYAQAGRKRVAEQFSPQVQADRLVSLYEECLR